MIDYKLLSESVDYYTSKSFLRVEVPWTVTEEVSAITRPKDSVDFKLIHKNNKVLLASGEQGFLYQYIKGYLPSGRFQTVTPCFRFENQDFLHSKVFIKNELIDTEHVTRDRLMEMVSLAKTFFLGYVRDISCLKIVDKCDDSVDIEYKGFELGSYGIREYKSIRWIYGTGLAEPRFSKVRNL